MEDTMAENRKYEQRSRPHFSKEYGVDTTNLQGLLPWSWVSEKMAASRNYWIVSSRKNGKPHVAPVWGIYFEEILYFSTSGKSLKAQNLKHNPSVIAHLESGDDTVIIEGTANTVLDKDFMEKLSEVYGQKYPGYQPPPDFGAGNVVFAIKPKTVFAWKESDFINTPTRWEFD
jgi:general stress protein 26